MRTLLLAAVVSLIMQGCIALDGVWYGNPHYHGRHHYQQTPDYRRVPGVFYPPEPKYDNYNQGGGGRHNKGVGGRHHN